jgi:hypothetical protein
MIAKHRTALSTLLLGATALGSVFLGTACSATDQSTEETPGSSVEGIDKIVYLVRQHTTIDEDGNVSINVAGGMGQVMDYRRYVPGGRVEVKDLRTGDVTNLLANERYRLADVVGLDVSFDAKKIVFAMNRGGDDGNYHIYTANLESNADDDWEITQLTFGGHDDLAPVWVAGGRIAFFTNESYTEMGTRADEYNHGQDVSQIATISEEGGDADRTVCSQNLSHTVNLFSMQSGQIGVSRWEHLENVNDLKVFAMNPDCTQMVAVAGQHEKFWNSLIQLSETPDRNVFVGIATDRENTIQSGALIRVDVRGDDDPDRLDEEKPDFTVLTPGVPLGMEAAPVHVGRYRAPYALPDGRILTSWASGFVNELDELSLTAPDYGIYLFDAEHLTNQLVVNHEGSWELDARPLIRRAEPPILSAINNSQDPAVPLTIGSIDVRNTSLYEVHGNTVSGAQFPAGTPIDQALQGAVKVRIIEGFSSEAAPGATMFGLTMAEGAALLGEAAVREDGSWMAHVPPFIPMHLQPLDEFDLSIRSQTTWIQGMPGESRVCGGCHERRTEPAIVTDQQLSVAAASRPENFFTAVASRTEYPWYGANAGFEGNEVQALLTAKCASCHNETTNGNGPQEFYTVTMTNDLTGEMTAYEIPRLDLTAREITVTYDREVRSWAASYVSLFYPAAMEMEMGMDTMVTGTVPPTWARPSDARNSALIEKLNITSSLDANRTAWPLGEAFSDPNIQGASRTMHPDDVGIELTREERLMLIRAIDMGGQYYSRQNTEYQPFASDPLGSSGVEY